MPFTLAPLPYAYDALEPFIDEATMRVHHDKHHQTYCDNFNNAVAGTEWAEKSAEDILRNLESMPADKKTAIRNHGGGFCNHNLFWTVMSPKKGGKPAGDLLKAMTDAFGGFESFQEKFTAAAVGQFGSGWAWLVVNQGKLEIVQTANQDSPISIGKVPLFTIDVWEHAYYLKYQNRRAEYVQAFWNVANWDEAAARFAQAK